MTLRNCLFQPKWPPAKLLLLTRILVKSISLIATQFVSITWSGRSVHSPGDDRQADWRVIVICSVLILKLCLQAIFLHGFGCQGRTRPRYILMLHTSALLCAQNHRRNDAPIADTLCDSAPEMTCFNFESLGFSESEDLSLLLLDTGK